MTELLFSATPSVLSQKFDEQQKACFTQRRKDRKALTGRRTARNSSTFLQLRTLGSSKPPCPKEIESGSAPQVGPTVRNQINWTLGQVSPGFGNALVK